MSDDEISIVAREGRDGWCKVYLHGSNGDEMLLDEADGADAASLRVVDMLLDLAQQVVREIKP